MVILTPDDVGKKLDSDELKPRARQNVILELGYFIAHLERKNVFVLKKGDIEIPTDFGSIVYTILDDAGAWKTTLAKEIKAAGIEVDFYKVAHA